MVVCGQKEKDITILYLIILYTKLFVLENGILRNHITHQMLKEKCDCMEITKVLVKKNYHRICHERFDKKT